MRVINLCETGEKVVLTDKWEQSRYKRFLEIRKLCDVPFTQKQKDDLLQTIKHTKENAIGIVVQNTLTQQFVKYAVEWNRNDFEERPPYAWFEEDEIEPLKE